jgi:TPR repeat protein
LVWQERGDLQAAVRWLDRAAHADDPAAQRDLGIVLRQAGDLHGAHYWLSRAAERDDQARQTLTELEDHNAGLPS